MALQHQQEDIPLEAIPDRPKRRYTKRAAKWGKGNKAKAGKPAPTRRKRAAPDGVVAVKLAFQLDGQRLELDLDKARALYAVLHAAFGNGGAPLG